MATAAPPSSANGRRSGCSSAADSLAYSSARVAIAAIRSASLAGTGDGGETVATAAALVQPGETGRAKRTVSALTGVRGLDARASDESPLSAPRSSCMCCQRASRSFSIATRDGVRQTFRDIVPYFADVRQLIVLLMVQHRVEAFGVPWPTTAEHLPRDKPEL